MRKRALLLASTLALAVLSCVSKPPAPSPATDLWSFEILDEKGAPAAARVTLLDAEGKGVAPDGPHVYQSVINVPFFYTSGRFSVRTPLASLKARICKGHEYEPVEREVRRGPSPTRIQLVQAFDMASKGFYCGDGHIHPHFLEGKYFPTNAELLEQMRAEGLNVANLQAANAFDARIFMAERVTGRDEPDSDPTHLMHFSEEYRGDIYGHMSVYGIKRVSDPVFTSFKDTPYPFDHPTNHEACLKYKADGAFPTFAHLRPGGKLEVHFKPVEPGHRDLNVWECPMDVALGSLNAIEIQGYAVWTTLAVPIWEKLMSAGFDVVVNAGTDCILSSVPCGPMGSTCAYVDMDGKPFTYGAWVDQLSKGRCFTTNGAMLLLKVDGKTPGETVDLKPGEAREVEVEVTVDSVFPWDKVAVRMNQADALVFTSAPGNPRNQSFRGKVALSGPSWIYAKLRGPWSPFFGAGPVFPKPDHEAITNAVWVRRGQEPRRDAASLDYFTRWAEDNLETLELRNNYGPGENRAKVRGTFEKALQVFRDRRAECAALKP